MTIEVLDDDGNPDPERVAVRRMIERIRRDAEAGTQVPAGTAYTSNSASAYAPSSFKLADLKALTDRIAEAERTRDRRVFRFRGTLAQFRAELRLAGVPVGPALALPGWPPMSIPGGLLSGLPCYEWGDSVYIGDDRDVLPVLEALERGEAVDDRVCEVRERGGER